MSDIVERGMDAPYRKALIQGDASRAWLKHDYEAMKKLKQQFAELALAEAIRDVHAIGLDARAWGVNAITEVGLLALKIEIEGVLKMILEGNEDAA